MVVQIPELVKRVENLVDMGVLTKHDESFVSHALLKFERGHFLTPIEISRLRTLVQENEN
jgi:hypothetical protein